MQRLFTYMLLPSLLGFFTLSSFAYQYGPVKPGETLWGIAKKVRPNSSVPVTKMMTVIQANNPHAFKNKNASSLMESVMLYIPDIKNKQQHSSTRTSSQKRQQLLRQLAENKQATSTQTIKKLKEELKTSQARFQKIEDRNQELLKKMQKLHIQLRELQVKMLERGEHTLNTHTIKENADS